MSTLCNVCNRSQARCPNCHCCNACCQCGINGQCNQSEAVSFTVFIRNCVTGEPIPGASYAIYKNGKVVETVTSGADGSLNFSSITPGCYQLEEVSAASGFQLDDQVHRIIVEPSGNVIIDGRLSECGVLCNDPLISLSFFKVNSVTGLPIPGAAFTLSNGQKAVSGIDGSVRFNNLSPGCYTLVESSVPEGYVPNTRIYYVEVSNSGEITINGVPISEFRMENQPSKGLTFKKTNQYGTAGLAGAEFRLSNGTRAVSDSNGNVDFGTLVPGIYTMRETAAPDGYQLDNKTYDVIVSDNGSITVNGIPVQNFNVSNNQEDRSQRPVITSVRECDRGINGAGVPGALITVTFPDGTQVDTAVDACGNWSIDVPNNMTIIKGDTILTNQTEPGLAPSENASFLVQGNYR